MTEKFDGIRAFWNGKELLSKQGRKLDCPSWMTAELPKNVKLDGELWIGRGTLENVVTLLNSSGTEENEMWKSVQYVIFDLPSSDKTYEERVDALRALELPSHAKIVETTRCKDNEHLIQHMQTIVADGGEGLMAVQPLSLYSQSRTDTMLKVKPNQETEVQVLEILPTGLYCSQ